MKCIVCNKPSENHHVKTRGSGGTDDDWNLMPLCRVCHTEVHKIGLSTFTIKYSKAYDWLLDHGWTLDAYNKWKHE